MVVGDGLAVVANRAWVGGLPHGITAEELEDAFSTCGRIKKVQIRQSQADTFAFLTFADRKSYETALETMNQSTCFGQPIKVNYVLDAPKTRGQDDRGDSYLDSSSKPFSQERDVRDVDDVRDRYPRDGRDRYSRSDDAGRGQRFRDSRPPSRDTEVLRRGAEAYDTRRSVIRDDRRYRARRGYDEYDDYGNSGQGRGRMDQDIPRIGRRLERDAYYAPPPRADSRPSNRGPPRRLGGYRGDERDVLRRDDPDGRRDFRNRDDYWDERGCRSPDNDRGRAGSGSAGGGEIQPLRLWVGGLPADITADEVESLFRRFGELQDVAIRCSRADTFGFVEYRRAEDANAAKRELNKTERFGSIITVAPSMKKGTGKGKSSGRDGKGCSSRSRSRRGGDRGGRGGDGKGRPSVRYCVQLSNLPPDMDSEELLDIASEYGEVLLHQIVSKHSGSTGTIEFGSLPEAKFALSELNDRRIDGWEQRIAALLTQRDVL